MALFSVARWVSVAAAGFFLGVVKGVGSPASPASSVTPKESREEEPFFLLLVDPERLTAGRMTAGRASSSSSAVESAPVVVSESSLMLILFRREEDLTGRRVNLTVDGDMAGGAVERENAHQLSAFCIGRDQQMSAGAREEGQATYHHS